MSSRSRSMDRRHALDAWTAFGTFLRAAARSPARIGAVAPSSRALAELITSQIDPGMSPILELGAGTGAFADALLRRGVSESQLMLVESDARLARLLGKRFPQAAVLCCDASDIARALHGMPAAGAAISGLPLRNMSVLSVRRIVQQAFACMRPDGALFQFTYGWRGPIDRALVSELSLECTRIGATWRNLPPATVYRYRERDWRHGGA